MKVTHVLSGVEIGGTERAVIRLAARGLREGMDQVLLLFDHRFRSKLVDFDPGNLETIFVERRPGVDFRFAAKLAKTLQLQRADIVHAHNDTAIFYSALALIIGRLRKTALISTFRTRPTAAKGGRLATRWACARAADITAVSQELNDWLVQSGWTRRCRTIWNGADLAEFRPAGHVHRWRDSRGIPPDAVVVGHVGRFAPIKRHVDLFDAASLLQLANCPLYFVFAGDGPLFEMFQTRASGNPKIIMLSNVEDIAAFLRSLDIFVLCSAHEGAPQALLEAMACGRAIISTRVGGIPYILDEEGPAPAARFIPPLRPDRLATAIIELAEDAGLRNQLGKLARRRAEVFSFDREWAEYSNRYLTVSRGSASSSASGNER